MCQIVLICWHISQFLEFSQDIRVLPEAGTGTDLDLLQSLKQFFANVSYNILVASLTLMALF